MEEGGVELAVDPGDFLGHLLADHGGVFSLTYSMDSAVEGTSHMSRVFLGGKKGLCILDKGGGRQVKCHAYARNRLIRGFTRRSALESAGGAVVDGAWAGGYPRFHAGGNASNGEIDGPVGVGGSGMPDLAGEHLPSQRAARHGDIREVWRAASVHGLGPSDLDG